MGDANETRAALVRAAFNVIAREGFEGLRTRAVADAAGVNISTLHYHFPTKEDLISAVIDDELMRRFREAPASRLGPDASAQEVLGAHFAAVRHWARNAPDVQVVWHEFWLRSMRDKALRDRVRNVMTRHRRSLQKALSSSEGALALGQFTASALASLLAGLTMYALVDPQAEEAEAIGRALMPMLLPDAVDSRKQSTQHAARRNP